MGHNYNLWSFSITVTRITSINVSKKKWMIPLIMVVFRKFPLAVSNSRLVNEYLNYDMTQTNLQTWCSQVTSGNCFDVKQTLAKPRAALQTFSPIYYLFRWPFSSHDFTVLTCLNKLKCIIYNYLSIIFFFKWLDTQWGSIVWKSLVSISYSMEVKDPWLFWGNWWLT